MKIQEGISSEGKVEVYTDKVVTSRFVILRLQECHTTFFSPALHLTRFLGSYYPTHIARLLKHHLFLDQDTRYCPISIFGFRGNITSRPRRAHVLRSASTARPHFTRRQHSIVAMSLRVSYAVRDALRTLLDACDNAGNRDPVGEPTFVLNTTRTTREVIDLCDSDDDTPAVTYPKGTRRRGVKVVGYLTPLTQHTLTFPGQCIIGGCLTASQRRS